jgi:hypothetical protein
VRTRKLTAGSLFRGGFLTLCIVLSVGNACKGKPANPVAPALPPQMTQAQGDKLATDLVIALRNGLNDCRSRLPNPNSFGTFQINISCGATTNCPAGGTIRTSLQMTGQVVVSQNNVVLNSPMSGSQNILDWGCAIGGMIVSGNPTVSLSGEYLANLAGFSARLDHSGQVVYGVRGEGSRNCAVSLRTTESTAATIRTNGIICGLTIAPF